MPLGATWSPGEMGRVESRAEQIAESLEKRLARSGLAMLRGCHLVEG